MRILMIMVGFLAQFILCHTLTFSQVVEQNGMSDQENEFYITRRGTMFPLRDCAMIKNFEIKRIGKEEALEKGMKPCSVCIKNQIFKQEVVQQQQQLNTGIKLEYLK